jgi:hypothetical protein
MLLWSILAMFLWGVTFLTHSVPVPSIFRPIALIAMIAICIFACPILGKWILAGFALVFAIWLLFVLGNATVFVYRKICNKPYKGKDRYE